MKSDDIRNQLKKLKESRRKNFLKYLGIEKQNLLTNMFNFRGEFELFTVLDKLYQEPLNRFLEVQDDHTNVIMSLYYFVHISYYFAFSCILRSQLLGCLSTTRKAIDAALSAYKIILEPNMYKDYLNGNKYFQFIKTKIKKEVEKDSHKYPLARTLFAFHELCSRFGSHADKDSFALILSEEKILDSKKCMRTFGYFQFYEEKETNQFFYITVLRIFLCILRIFKDFFDKKLKVMDIEWEKTIDKFNQITIDLLKKYEPSNKRE